MFCFVVMLVVLFPGSWWIHVNVSTLFSVASLALGQLRYCPRTGESIWVKPTTTKSIHLVEIV